MKALAFRLWLSMAAAILGGPAVAEHSRLIVITDIGNEPDDQMSLVRLLVYANDIDIEGIIAATSTWQRHKISPEIARGVIAAYGKVLPNLRRHASGWPSAEALSARITTGVAQYGLGAARAALLSDGARSIIAAVDAPDARPLWIALWGGANTLAQALDQVRKTRTPAELAIFVAKLRISAISDQDDAGPWIRREFPGLFYIVKPSSPDGADYASATWTGISGDRYYRNATGADFTTVSNAWLDKHIRSKGPLGAAYPRYQFIMEGDTPSILGLIPNGLESREHPDWGGWGGRYVLRTPYGETRPIWTQGGDNFGRVTSADTIGPVTSDQATIWRWRAAFQNDFAARMDWTVQPYAQANHPPVVMLTGPRTLALLPGQSAMLDASLSTDPDGNRLHFHWFHYREAGFTAGTNMAELTLANANSPRVTVTAKSPCREMWMAGLVPCNGAGTAHLVLAVSDDGVPPLTRYARVIVTVAPDR